MPLDYKQYHPKWKKISWFIRHYRAKQKCEWCGAENGFPHPKTGSIVVLTVAHLDHDKTNNSFFNLKALCQKCHLKHDLKYHVWKRIYGRLEEQGQQKLY
jgi:5-methylcytosine-specific restriction endonuclease McrA